MSISLHGRVAVVTGAGNGLGRSHALALAAHGARVVVNDLAEADAERVAAEIRAAGGEAIGVAASVTDAGQVAAMVERAIGEWEAIDILVNNAGILRDKSFAKMDLADFRLVVDVHLMGAVHCTKAVWDHMRARNHGRIVFTTSSSGLYGNFGQANYGAAKMALVGLMQTLAIEGAKNGIHVNCIAPTAATAMTADIFDETTLARLTPDRVSPAIVMLASDAAPTRRVILAGAGSFEQANITMTQGLFLGAEDDVAGALLDRLDGVADRAGELVPGTGFDQCRHEIAAASVTVGA
ncbi:short-chain dehydrogenase/reductase SDR [Rhizorhabdus wittichii RW1]|uniref:Short-chain dehydrogenase/reductase SDR n=1 Tax=Rhizorhabdus wittichii (strain DSM 6014 / CCUG 31198 / JCM 15750 / NBRC 105917 / EY 4224 / RW1) TaxID=392499 RepID=A0A9J9HBP2_RHIWR|nr:short-chain dehydrogenase/reductase SDR [Rhizorhabdus wittichii RW1]